MTTLTYNNKREEMLLANWRIEAMDAALGAEAADGNSEDALLREIRRYQSGIATMMLWTERTRLLEFLHSHAVAFRSLLPGSDRYCLRGGEQDTWPYLGWYAAEFENVTIEVALTPNGSCNGYVICLANDEAVLDSFTAQLAEYAIRPAGRSLRYTEGWANAPELDAELGRVTWDDVVLAPAVIAGLREAAEGFFANRDAFKAFGFAWRRGVLLIGPPGTGKTMICKAIASSLPELPFLYVRDLREDDHQEAIEAIFKRARKLAPCILAFEDMDGLVNETNRTLFLNELDGFQNNEGLLIVASSNHPHKIDEALLKRPSRFDRVFHIGLPELDERREYCRRLLSRPDLAARFTAALDVEALAAEAAERSRGFTPAYLKEAFIGAALQRAQAGAINLDEEFGRAVLAQVDELRLHLKRMQNSDMLAEMTGSAGTLGFRP